MSWTISSRAHVAVDVLPVQYEYQHEVWLERLDLPRQVKIGETYEASVLLNSLQPGDGKLVLRENGKVIAEQTVHYERGKNRYALPLYFREPGYYEYVATIEPPAGQDGWQENNTAINFLYLKGEGKVLLVTDPQGDPRDWETLVKALKEAQAAGRGADGVRVPARCDVAHALRLRRVRQRRRRTASIRCKCNPCATRFTTRASGF